MSRLHLLLLLVNHKGYFYATVDFFLLLLNDFLSSFAFIKQTLPLAIPFKLIIITPLSIKHH